MAVKLSEKQRALIEEGVLKNGDQKALEVKNLVISFRTDNGKVQAVRGVSFDLYKGETLCIVGESGSGKSVTSKAIMGILAANALVEGGQIVYEGEDLLKVSEEEFHRIRGHKIGMIFQDPLSSLNPIVKIGKQITETMLINSNQLKNHYKDLIAPELTDYKNAAVERNADISMANIAYNNVLAEQKKALKPLEDEIAALKVDLKAAQKALNSTAEIDKKIAEKNAAYEALKKEWDDKAALQKAKSDEIIAKAKEHYKEVAPGLKAKLKERKKTAKVENKQYALDLKAKRDETVAKLEEEKKALGLTQEQLDQIASYDAQIKSIKRQYKFKETLVYFLNKKKQKLKAEAEEKISELLKKRGEIAKDLDVINTKIAEAEEEYGFSIKVTKSMAKKKALRVMQEVGIPFPEARFKQYPFQFSGGMRQRIVIAIALIAEPDILICDEPTTALDVTIQAQILELINRLKAAHDMSVIFITHDLGVVANMADRVAVMYAGKIVEYGTDKEIFFDPRHPYTWALLSSIPDIDSKERLEAIPGTPPDMIYPPVGDAFALRNKYALGIDFKYDPPLFEITPTHYAATWLEYEGAPDVEPPKIVTQRIYNALKEEEEKQNAEQKS
ncbi:MAG: ATP-binding cassette domain-containing protein [Bacillota bacterium]|nr:ATP-binding cassette domain-containing protein [Bacillota bacterium]